MGVILMLVCLMALGLDSTGTTTPVLSWEAVVKRYYKSRRTALLKRRWIRASERAMEKVCAARKRTFLAIEAQLASTARNACGTSRKGDSVAFVDMWCVDAWDGSATTVRSFGHPQGMCYIGKSASFLYLPIPKVATTTGRKWARQAYKEDRAPEMHVAIPTRQKPQADRMDGAALFRKLPVSIKTRAVSFAFVRDPLMRFASAWREIQAYEQGPPRRRGWGKLVLKAQPFYNTTRRELKLGLAIRDLACFRDWNEHLTPQAFFFPEDFEGVVPPVDILPQVLPLAAAAANLSADTARSFAEATANPSQGWPQPEEISVVLDEADRLAGLSPPTKYVWCWVYTVDYATFDYFQPPAFCEDAWQALGLPRWPVSLYRAAGE